MKEILDYNRRFGKEFKWEERNARKGRERTLFSNKHKHIKKQEVFTWSRRMVASSFS